MTPRLEMLVISTEPLPTDQTRDSSISRGGCRSHPIQYVSYTTSPSAGDRNPAVGGCGA
jgi:hypothetical protein